MPKVQVTFAAIVLLLLLTPLLYGTDRPKVHLQTQVQSLLGARAEVRSAQRVRNRTPMQRTPADVVALVLERGKAGLATLDYERGKLTLMSISSIGDPLWISGDVDLTSLVPRSEIPIETIRYRNQKTGTWFHAVRTLRLDLDARDFVGNGIYLFSANAHGVTKRSAGDYIGVYQFIFDDITGDGRPILAVASSSDTGKVGMLDLSRILDDDRAQELQLPLLGKFSGNGRSFQRVEDKSEPQKPRKIREQIPMSPEWERRVVYSWNPNLASFAVESVVDVKEGKEEKIYPK